MGLELIREMSRVRESVLERFLVTGPEASDQSLCQGIMAVMRERFSPVDALYFLKDHYLVCN